jgi:hypothetical protein
MNYHFKITLYRWIEELLEVEELYFDAYQEAIDSLDNLNYHTAKVYNHHGVVCYEHKRHPHPHHHHTYA